MKIAFVTIADLPEGAGNTSRLRMLIRALIYAGHEVTIWNEHPLGIAPIEKLSVEGTLEGAHYKHALGSTKRSHGFGIAPQKLKAIRSIKQWVKDKCGREELDILWFNNLSFYDTWPLTRLAKKLNVKTIQSYEDERQELVSGEVLSLSRRLFALNSRLGDRFCPAMADTLITISEYLNNKYTKLAGSGKEVHLVPTIIDCNEWECPPEPETSCPVILYSGAFGEQDEMSCFIAALSQLKDKGQAFRCVLLGNNTREQWRVEAVKDALNAADLADQVDMPGFVSREQVRAYLAEASILINIRRDGPWSRSGLSTKLSEYLASGRMVLTSAVGDVPNYLSHMESALIVSGQPTADEISRALTMGLDSLYLRRKIGSAGLAVAKRFFDVPVAAAKLDGILGDLSE